MRRVPHIDGSRYGTVLGDRKLVAWRHGSSLTVGTTVRKLLGNRFSQASSVTSDAIEQLNNGSNTGKDDWIEHATCNIRPTHWRCTGWDLHAPSNMRYITRPACNRNLDVGKCPRKLFDHGLVLRPTPTCVAAAYAMREGDGCRPAVETPKFLEARTEPDLPLLLESSVPAGALSRLCLKGGPISHCAKKLQNIGDREEPGGGKRTSTVPGVAWSSRTAHLFGATG
eukprot:CAMPEP_0194494632 /NCGR_PEP_ID=MMETSP0253-20130528/12484_1 /TAXON_ID=2966 /ORGANISM="Noctiluca scintillans" /LENGTH=225 /DNA_ID=CAMNT_0039335775 /DNA_START=111 /DNA_END=785 /DNA_ORIENTATION=+